MPVSSFAPCTYLMTSALCRKYREGIEVSEAKPQIRSRILAGFNPGPRRSHEYEKQIRGSGVHGSIARLGQAAFSPELLTEAVQPGGPLAWHQQRTTRLQFEACARDGLARARL